MRLNVDYVMIISWCSLFAEKSIKRDRMLRAGDMVSSPMLQRVCVMF